MRQHGISLISLMVGVAISLITIVAMMTLYKNTLQMSARSSADAKTDALRVGGFMAAHTAIKSAGYGVDATLKDHLLYRPVLMKNGQASAGVVRRLVNGKVLQSVDQAVASKDSHLTLQGSLLVWSWSPDANGVLLCSGLFAPSAGGLYLLDEQVCASVNDWNTQPRWSVRTLIAESMSRNQADTQLLNDMIQIELIDHSKPKDAKQPTLIEPCLPFGIGHHAPPPTAAASAASGIKPTATSHGAVGWLSIKLKTQNSNDWLTESTNCLANFAHPAAMPTAAPTPGAI